MLKKFDIFAPMMYNTSMFEIFVYTDRSFLLMIHILKRRAVKLAAALVGAVITVSSFASVSLAANYRGVVTASVLNVRSQPNTSCAVVGQYYNGTALDITGVEGNWYKISFNGSAAYVSKDYVSLGGTASRSDDGRTKGQRVVDIAKQYIGAPYVYGGMSPSGFDCSGLVKYCYGQMGISLNRTAASQTAHGTWVAKENLVPGDLVFFSIGGYISHVGIYAGGGMMVHSPSPGKSVELITINSGYYANHYSSGRRIY